MILELGREFMFGCCIRETSSFSFPLIFPHFLASIAGSSEGIFAPEEEKNGWW